MRCSPPLCDVFLRGRTDRNYNNFKFFERIVVVKVGLAIWLSEVVFLAAFLAEALE